MIDEKLKKIIEKFKVNTAIRLIKSLVIESLGKETGEDTSPADLHGQLRDEGFNQHIAEMKKKWK